MAAEFGARDDQWRVFLVPAWAVLSPGQRVYVDLFASFIIYTKAVGWTLICSETTSFVPNLVRRQDHGFHIYGRLYQLSFKLGRRCIRPKSHPQVFDYTGILNIVVSDTPAPAVPEFRARSKLDQRLSTACNIKAERELSDKTGGDVSLTKVIKDSKKSFWSSEAQLCRLSIPCRREQHSVNFWNREKSMLFQPSILGPWTRGLYRTDGKRPDGVTMIRLGNWVTSCCGMSRLRILLHPVAWIQASHATRQPRPLSWSA